MQASEGQSIMVRGRIVWVSDDLFKGRKKVDQFTKQPMFDAKTGSQKVEYGFGLAVPKAEAVAMLGAMQAEAAKLYPGGRYPPDFAWKVKDGDGVDHKGNAFNQREGYAGHWVFALTTSIPIKFFRWENGANIQIADGIKCGDWLSVQVSMKAHGPIGQGKAGLYLNPMAAQLWKIDKEIINTPSGDAIFGVGAPVGMDYTQQPMAQLVPTGAGPQAFPMGQPPAHVQQQMYPGMPPAGAPQAPPHYGVLPASHQPPMPPQGNGMPGFVQPAANPGYQAQAGQTPAVPASPFNQQQTGLPPGFPQ